jgi:hypothetical protein
MGTLFRGFGLRVYIWTNDHDHPRHVHVHYADCKGVWDLDRHVWLKMSRKCGGGDLRRMEHLLVELQDTILEQWNDHWQQIRRDARR